MDKLISIIIPFHNVEPYIEECLDSVFHQDIPMDSYEVICVNDGSTDGSLAIVERYLIEYKNLQLINHPYNINLGTARNTGIKAATGKYIWHVDSDDYIASNCLKSIVDICDERCLDVLEFGYIGANNCPVSKFEPKRTSDVVTGQEYVRKYFLANFGGISPIWRRVYRRGFLIGNNILSPSINMGEDDVYAVHVFAIAKKVSFEPKDWYIHRVNSQSLVGEDKSQWSAQKWYEASIVCGHYVHQIYKRFQEQLSSDIRKKIVDMIVYDILYYQRYESIMSKEAAQGFWHLCRSHFWENLFLFKYLSNKRSADYIKRILFAR